MQKPIPAQSNAFRVPNPLVDFAVSSVETQLKFWQAFQVEGASFVAKRLRANLEQLRALGHCCDAQSIGECQLAWAREIHKDYAEELTRLAVTAFTLGFTELNSLGGLFGGRVSRAKPAAQAIEGKSNPSFPSQA